MSPGAGHGGPAKGRGNGSPRAEPFERGNEVAKRHGAFSPRYVEPRAAELIEAATAAIPFLAAPEYSPAIHAWGRAEASVSLLAEWLGQHGLIDDDGKPRPAVEALLKFERLALEHRGRLGLDPTSRAKLEREMADAARGRFDLDALVSEGREALAVRSNDDD